MIRPLSVASRGALLCLAALLACPVASAEAQRRRRPARPEVTSDPAPPPPPPAPPPPPSRDEEARQAFLRGRDAHERGDFETALTEFQLSYGTSGRPEILYNIATSFDRLGRFDEALEYFRRYLEATQEAENREFVEARMRVLQQLIDRRTATEAEAEAARRAVTEAQSPPSVIPPVLVLGAGAAMGIVSVGLLVRGQNQLDDLEATCEAGGCRDVNEAIRESGVERSRRTVRALGIGGAAVAAGGVLWLLLQDRGSDDPEAESGVQVRTTVGLGSIHFSGSF